MPTQTRRQAALAPIPQVISGLLGDRVQRYPESLRGSSIQPHPRWFGFPPEIIEMCINFGLTQPLPFCVFDYFCHRWGICAPCHLNGGPFPGAELGIVLGPGGAMIRDPLRLDLYTRGADGAPGTLQIEVAPHGTTQSHFNLPVYRWLADYVLGIHWDRFTWFTAINVLARNAMQVLERETFVVGPAPAPGAADTRHLGFRGFMISPCLEQYFGGPSNFPVPGQPFPDRGFNSNERNMGSVFYSRTAAHHLFMQATGEGSTHQNIENEAAQFLKNKWNKMGGPIALFLGPEVMDGMKSGTTAQWQARVAAQDPRSSVTTINWSRMTRLEILAVDFYDFRVMNANAGNPGVYGDTDTWIVNTVAHILNEWTNPDGTRRNPGLKKLLIGGLRTDIERGAFTAQGPPMATYNPLYENPAVPPPIALVEGPAPLPGAPGGSPNWFFHFRQLLRPGGQLFLLDMDQIHAALPFAGDIVGPYDEF